MVRGWDLSGGSRPRRRRRPYTGFKCRRRQPRRGVNAGGAPQATGRSNPRRRRCASRRPMRRDNRVGSQQADTSEPAERKQAAVGRCTKKTRQPPALRSLRVKTHPYKHVVLKTGSAAEAEQKPAPRAVSSCEMAVSSRASAAGHIFSIGGLNRCLKLAASVAFWKRSCVRAGYEPSTLLAYRLLTASRAG